MKFIPELRFPELENQAGWNNKKLGDHDISNILRGGSPRPITDYLTDNDEGLNWLKIGDVDKESKFVINTEDKVLPSALSKTREVFPGDLIMSNSMSFGRPYILKIQTCIHDGWIALTEINQEIDTDFLYYLILSDGSQRYFTNSAAGGGIKNLNAEIIKKLPIAVPSIIEEQQKIASCLSSLDELIAAHNDKLDALKDHKKGLLQNLFPQEGETVPKVRFPEFENDGEWGEKKLGEIGDPLMCKRVFKEQTTPNPENGIPFYKIGTFGKEPDSYISPELYEEFKSKYNFPNKGDILISASGTIGRLVVYDGEPAYFQDSNLVWLGHPEKEVSNDFLYYCYSIVNWQTSDGGVIKRLYNSDLKTISIKFPENEAEQQKIASCLSALNELISAQTEKIEQLQQHKKGLMQGLFPKIES